MTNNLPLPLSTLDANVENPTIIDRHSLIHSNDPLTPGSQNYEQKPSSSYLTLSVGDHRHFGSSNFQDPLFYQQPLPLYYNQPIPSTTESGHETGDRARLTNEIALHEYRKQKSVSSHQHRIDKSKSTHRRYTNSKKSKEKMIKEKEKKVSRRNMNKRQYKNRKINRNSTQQLRYQSKYNQALLLKRRQRQQMLLKKKKKLLKQRMASKKRSLSKVNKAKSLVSSQHARKINPTNNRVTSTVSPRRSSTSKLTRTRSITQSKTETTGSQPSSMTQLSDNPETEIVSDQLKNRTDISPLDPVSQLTSKQMMNEQSVGVVVVTKHVSPPPSDKFFPSSVHPPLSSKTSPSVKLEQQLSKRNILSKSNVRKLPTSKSKQIKQRNSRGTKLNIRSPTHTTFKKYVRHYRTRRSTGRKIKFPRCTSKTLITIAPMNTNNENMTKSVDINNDNIHTKTSSSLFSLKDSLSKKQLSTSTVMPLTKTSAQLTSKNNNRCILKMTRQRSSLISRISEENLKEPTRRGMTLRSRTIIINNDNSTERKERKYK